MDKDKAKTPKSDFPWKEVLTFLGVIITAYIGYLGIRSQNEIPIRATQTAEAKSAIATQTSIASSTMTPTATPTETVRPIAIDEEKYVIIHPSCNCTTTVTQFSAILIRLRWGAKTSSLAEQGANFITYTAVLDGQPVSGIEKYRVPAVLVAEPKFPEDVKNTWWVYWDYPLEHPLAVGSHELTVVMINSKSIDNGWSITPAGTKITFVSTINVVQAEVP